MTPPSGLGVDQQGVVVADAEDPASPLRVRACGERLQLGDDVVDRVDAAIGRGEQVGAHSLTSELLGVRMAIDEPWQQSLASEVDHPRRLSPMRLLNVRPRAYGEDLSALDRQCLGARLFVVHGDDRATNVDRIRQ